MIYITKVPDKQVPHYDFQIEPEQVIITCTTLDGDVSTCSINLSDIKNKRNFESCSLWHVNKISEQIFELFRITFSSKQGISEIMNMFNNSYHNFRIFVPNSDCTFEDCSFLVSEYINGEMTTGNTEIKYVDPQVNIIKKVMPEIKLIQSHPLENGLIQFSIGVLKDNGELHPGTFTIELKSTKGYLPIRKIDYKGELVPFVFSPLYLDKDEVVTIKAGYKYYSNVSSVDFAVGT